MNAREFFKHWDEVRAGLMRALDTLSDEQLDYVPREGMRSIGDVLRHIGLAEANWIHFILVQNPEAWIKEYTPDDYPTVESIKEMLMDNHDLTNTYLKKLSWDDLSEMVEVPGGQKFSKYWVIWHTIDHEFRHQGEVFLMMGLMGLDMSDM